MKCKYEHDDDCCYSCADQYMCKCKQPCEFLDPMTNADRIRAMSDDELIEFIKNIKVRAALCKAVKNNDAFEKLCSAEWIQQPAEGE